MKTNKYLDNYKRQKETQMNKSSSATNLRDSYTPKERWKSRLKRKMIHKHVLEDEPIITSYQYLNKYGSPKSRGTFNN